MKFTNTDCVGKVVSCDLDSQVEGQMYHWEWWWRAHNYFFSFTFAKKEIVVYYIKETFL